MGIRSPGRKAMAAACAGLVLVPMPEGDRGQRRRIFRLFGVKVKPGQAKAWLDARRKQMQREKEAARKAA